MMPRIECRYNAVRSAAGSFDSYASQINGLYDDVRRIADRLPLNTQGYRMIKNHLSTNGLRAINNTEKKMRRIANALEEISELYKNTDGKVAGKGLTIEGIAEAVGNLFRSIESGLPMPDGVARAVRNALPFMLGSLYFKTDMEQLSSDPLWNKVLNTVFGSNKYEYGYALSVFSGSLLGLIGWNGRDLLDYCSREVSASLVKGSPYNKDMEAKKDALNDLMKKKGLRKTYHYNSDDREGDSDKVKDSHKYAERAFVIAGCEAEYAHSFKHADGDISLGDLTAKGSVDVSKVSASKGAGLGEYTYKDKDGNVKHGAGVYAEVGASYSVLEANGEVRKGNDIIGAYGKGYAKVGSVSGEAGVHCAMTESGPQIYAGGSAEAVAAEIGGSTGVTVAGVDVGVKGSVKVGVGVEGNIGIKDGHFVCDFGASLGVGFSVGIDIDASGFCKVCDDIGKGVENVWKSASEGVGNFFGGLFKW